MRRRIITRREDAPAASTPAGLIESAQKPRALTRHSPNAFSGEELGLALASAYAPASDAAELEMPRLFLPISTRLHFLFKRLPSP